MDLFVCYHSFSTKYVGWSAVDIPFLVLYASSATFTVQYLSSSKHPLSISIRVGLSRNTTEMKYRKIQNTHTKFKWYIFLQFEMCLMRHKIFNLWVSVLSFFNILFPIGPISRCFWITELEPYVIIVNAHPIFSQMWNPKTLHVLPNKLA